MARCEPFAKGVRGEPVEARVGPYRVVVVAPALQGGPSVREAPEQVLVEAFVAEPPELREGSTAALIAQPQPENSIPIRP